MLSKYENFLIGQIPLQVAIIIRELLVRKDQATYFKQCRTDNVNSVPFIHVSVKLI